jgi:SAM-dependent methyltransferase
LGSQKATAGQAAAAAAVEAPRVKARQRAMWALGDYHKFATTSTWGFGQELVAACDIGPGQRVLDVGAGSGNVAIQAAEAGARVVASDLTPENFGAGRREARTRGVELEWVEADAEALPFRDGQFDVVTSAVGAIFAPDHQRVADELLRVCRSGGTIGMIAIVPSGFVVDLFETIERYSRRPVFASTSPLLWGEEDHVRELFVDRVEWLQLRRERLLLHPFADPVEFLEYFKQNHPVMVWLYREAAAQPGRVGALDRELLDVVCGWMRRTGEGLRIINGEYLMIVARKRPGLSAASG